MADEPENLVLHLLREMREEMRTGFAAANERLDRVEGKVDRLEGKVDSLEAESKTQSELLGKVIGTVTSLANGQNQLVEAVQIIEHDISGIKMRIERIERHTGLVKA